MAILKTSLEEPLLSRDEQAVIRVIAHVAQIAEAMKALQSATGTIIPTENPLRETSELNNTIKQLNEYLMLKAQRALTQVRLPATKSPALKEQTTEPSKKA